MNNSLILQMEEYATEHNIPIMNNEGIDFLEKIIKENQIVSILEIGSAIGYSAIRMATCDNGINIVTVERDENRYIEAVKNIKEANLEDRITIIHNDAFLVEIDKEFDLIFIDAAKSQYIKFFEKFKKNLSPKGIIISDNLSFHGYVDMKDRIESKNLRQLVGKIRRYIRFLESNSEFETTFYDLGDGVAVSKRR